MNLRLIAGCLSALLCAPGGYAASVEPNAVALGHGQEIKITLDAPLAGAAQITLTPSGAFAGQNVVLPAAALGFVRQANTLWVTLAGVGLVGYTRSSDGRYFETARFSNPKLSGPVTLWGDQIIVADSSQGLLFLKPALRGTFRLVGNLPWSGNITALASANEHVCVITDEIELGYRSLRSAGEPQALRMRLGSRATAVAATPDQCFVAGPALGLLAAAPQNGVLTINGRSVVQGGAWDVAAQGARIVAAQGDSGVVIYDAQPRAGNLAWLGSYGKLGHVVRVDMEGARVAALDQHNNLSWLDISRVDTPVLLAATTISGSALGVSARASEIAVNTGTTIQLVDVSAENPPAAGATGLTLGGSRRAALRQNILYVADWFSGLHLYDVATPQAPRLLANLHTPGSPKGVLLRDNFAFVADDDHGVQVVDISAPQTPRIVANIALEGLAYTMKMSGDYLFVAAHRGGFHIVDVKDPRAPRRVGGVDTPGKAWALEVRDQRLYVADDTSGLLIFDISDVESPKLIGSYASEGNGAAEDVFLRDQYALVAFFDQGIQVLDISDAEKPRLITRVATPGNARGLALRGDTLYVAAWYAGLLSLDVKDPAQPRLLAQLDTDGAAWGVNVEGDNAFILDWWGGVKTADVRDPQRPRLLGRYQGRDTIEDVAMRGNMVYAASGADGVQIYDVTNGTNPMWSAGLELPGRAQSVAVIDQNLWVACGDAGVAVVDISAPFEPRLRQTLPVRGGAQKLAAVPGGTLVLQANGALYIAQPDADGWAWQRSPSLRVSDFTVADGLIYAIGEQGLTVSAADGKLLQRLSLRYTPIALAAEGGRVLVYERVGLHLFEGSAGNLKERGFLNINTPVRGLAIRGGQFFYTADGAGFNVGLIAGGQLQLRNTYPATARLTRFALNGDTVFLAGEALLSALDLVPDITPRTLGARELGLTVPAGLALGRYDVTVRDVRNQPINIRNAFAVRLQKPDPPKVTLEDIKRALDNESASGRALGQ